ncbi:MAG: Gfo/Idh/MocA family oxidoreductase [Actinomycetota bacterium]|nr:Gfo/Idh/MocA family oxidoreductase [Actinomycetota bacterium]
MGQGLGRPRSGGTPTFELAAVVDSSSEALAWAARELDKEAGACYSSLRQATAGVDCDAVRIGTPPETHRALAGIALGAGKHVLVEKPLATTLEDAHEIVELARPAELSIVVGQNNRFTPAARAIKGLMMDGSLGAVVSVRIESRQDTGTVFGTAAHRCAAGDPSAVPCLSRARRGPRDAGRGQFGQPGDGARLHAIDRGGQRRGAAPLDELMKLHVVQSSEA